MKIDSKNIPEVNDIAVKFANEVRRADLSYNGQATLEPKYEPILLTDFNLLLHEYLPLKNNSNFVEQYLNYSLLEQELNYIDQDSKILEHYPPGYILQLCPIPFSSNGNKLSNEEMRNGIYLRKLLLTPDNKKTLSGFSQSPSNINKYLPNELLNCSFKIPNYNESGLLTQKDRNILKQKFITSFENLRAIFS